MQRKDSWRACLYCGKTRYESQIPLSSSTEQHLRTVRPVNEQPPGLFAEHTDRFIVDDNDKDSDTDAESDMSLKSRSFLHTVNDRVRKIQDQSSKDATQDSNKRSLIWWMFTSSTLDTSVSMGKHYSEHLRSSNIQGTISLKTDVRDIWKVDSRTIRRDLWSEYNQLGRFFMETLIFDRWWRSHQSLAREGLRIFRFCVMPWKGSPEPTIKLHGKTSWRSSRVHHNTELWTRLMVSQQNSSGIFPRIRHIAALQQSPRVPVKNEQRGRKTYRTDHLHVDVQRHLMGIPRQ